MIPFILSSVQLLLSTLLVGIIAGFSPVLYTLLVGFISKGSKSLKPAYTIIAGVTSAVFVISAIFLLVQPETINFATQREFLDTLGGKITDTLLGVVSLIIGVFLLVLAKKPKSQKPLKQLNASKNPKKALTGTIGLFSFAFARSAGGITGVAALLFGVRLILHSNTGFIIGFASYAMIFAGAVGPYILLVILYKRFSHRIDALQVKLKAMRKYFSARTAGWVLVLLSAGFFLLSLTA